MKRIYITIISFFHFLFCIFLINSSFAQQCNLINVPTLPGEYTDLPVCACIGATPSIIASSDEIAPGGSITLYVNSGGLACPPYEWSVNAPYSIDAQTDNDFETVTLSAPAGACSGIYNDSNVVANVTVADQCGESNQIKIRNTAGGWSSGTFLCGGCCPYNSYAGNAIGKYRYIIGLTNGGGSVYYCTETCPAMVLSNLTAYGFPNSDGYSFACDSNLFWVTLNGANYTKARKGWPVYVFKQEWECP